MAGTPKKRARREAAAAGSSSETASRARAPRARPTSKRKPGQPAKARRGVDRPRFEPAGEDDFARVEAGVARAASAAEAAGAATTPAARKAALEGLGLKPTGRATDDRALLLAAGRVRRDEGIVAAWALGLTPPTIATQFNLSARQVERIIDAHRARRSRVVFPSSSELLHDALESLEAQMERCTLFAADGKAAESARVGAVRTWQALWLSRLELLQIMGKVSEAPSAEARLARARDLLRSLLDALRAEGVDQAALDRAATRILNDADADGVDLANVVAIEGRAR